MVISVIFDTRNLRLFHVEIVVVLSLQKLLPLMLKSYLVHDHDHNESDIDSNEEK